MFSSELRKKHFFFRSSKRKHVVLITNHGCHSPQIRVTVDTGGQNFYVNSFAKALVAMGYKVTILNRGGYRLPVTGKLHRGIYYYNGFWEHGRGRFCRVMYLEDGEKRFVNKERLKKHNLVEEADFFFKCMEDLGENPGKIYFINSHYWDAGILGKIIRERIKKECNKTVPHIWTPHSLGILKRKNYLKSSKKEFSALNFPSRISSEERVIADADVIVSTSNKIHRTLSEYRARVNAHFWFPPCVDTQFFRPRKLSGCKKALSVLAGMLKKKNVADLIRNNVVFIEVSRTAKPKQKDVIMKAFSLIKNKGKAMLIITCDKGTVIYTRLKELYSSLENKDRIIMIEEFLTDEEISQLYSLADVYVTASIMEGWGMAVQEAAASKCAIISSRFVPFVTEVLKENALIVNKQKRRLYAEKMDALIKDESLRKGLSERAYKIVAEEGSWTGMARKFLSELKMRNVIR